MHNKICSTAVIMLLFLAGCIPTKSIMVQTPAVIQPKIAVTRTGTAISIRTPAPAAAARPVLSMVGRVMPRLVLQAQSAVLLDASTGEVLYAKNAHQKMYPASTTKIMTAILGLEYFKADEIIRVGEEANLSWNSERIDATKAGLNYGQEITMKELLYGLLLASGSDAALTIAVNVAKRESGNDFLANDQALTNFSALMNQKAMSIGAVETNFTNPDGMQDANHYSTADDLAFIARYGMQMPQFREIVAASTYTAQIVTRDGGTYPRTWENTNRLIQPQDEYYYALANGIKTGTTSEAGYCLISSAMVGDHLVIAVILNSTRTGVWSDSITLLQYANDNPPVKNKKNRSAPLVNEQL
jgi:serine-type D-Ala-D-Ala carboxypeptidase (penicillin-binding protein 5/6)